MATSLKAMRLPKRWTEAELQSDAATARSTFRNERLLEPPFDRPRCLRKKGAIAQRYLAARAAHISGLTRSPRQDQDVRAGMAFAGTSDGATALDGVVARRPA